MERATIYIFLVALTCISLNYAREIPSPPFITKQPPPDEVLFQVSTDDSDKPFYIECEATGEPAPKYRWMKNGKHFDWQAYDDRISQQLGRGTLAIAKPRDVDLGQYQCFAENEYGVATSNSVFMRKAELGSFKQTEKEVVVGDEGQPFQLKCQPPTGFPKPKVNWMLLYSSLGLKTINSSRITLDPEGNLWFSNLTMADESDGFSYACTVTSHIKLEYKIGNRFHLKVRSTGISASQNKVAPVQQYVTKKNEVALRGKQVELFCIYGGTPLPQTVWLKDGRPIQASERVTQGNYGKSLKIKAVDFNDNGTYTCEVSNGVGSAQSYSINLKIRAVPYFTVEPEIRTAAEGETVEFNCEASGIPEPEIKWIHNGKPIAEAPPNPRRKVYKNKIVIENLSKKDTGNYGCNATNSDGYVYKDVYVNVLALSPEIVEAPRDMEAVVGQDLNMTCKVFGAPKPVIRWIHNDKELTGGRYTIQSSGDLAISKVQFDDAGNYTCFAENKFGNKQASATFRVKSATYISDGPDDYEVPAGQSATFRCNAVADPTLPLEISWLQNNEEIDFDEEPRFVKSSDYSLTIKNTIELDSGTYTCVAMTALDQAEARAQLTVQDVPNAPRMLSVSCQSKDATISWTPMGDNRAPILGYIIQYNTSFTPDTWENAYENVPASEMTYNVPMSPWANYTFRIIAWNKIGKSQPSAHSDVCTTSPDVPYKNPDNVIGEGDRPDNLVIRWTPMPEIEHNAPKFQYRVFYKRDKHDEPFIPVDITDWRQDRLVIDNQESFQQYRIKVIAMNELGEANVSPTEVIGYSGENEPTEAPTNFTLVEIQSATTAWLSWNPVPESSIRGHFKGYKIRTWVDDQVVPKEIQVQGEAHSALVNLLVPFRKNYAQVYAYNGKYNGPPSETLSFDTPEGPPEPVRSFEAHALGSSSFLLIWEEPEQPNGILTGYKISYAVVNGTSVGKMIDRQPQIINPKQTRAKLARLKPDTKYRIAIKAVTGGGEGKPLYIESMTRPHSLKPIQPDFRWERYQPEGVIPQVKVIWEPNPSKRNVDNLGASFYVQYKRVGETDFKKTKTEDYEEFIIVPLGDGGDQYEFKIAAVDGDHFTESETKVIDLTEEGPLIKPSENVATAGWFIGMMLAIAFLLLVLIMVCILKRNRGGKYAVHEREQANGRHDYQDEAGFHEYSQPLDNKSHGRASMSSEPKVGPESDTDSMAEYGEGDTEGMNEDGSFIGQYGHNKRPASQGRFTEDGSFIGQYVPSNMKQLSAGAPANSTTFNNAMATYV